jgi:hypothetical protein
MKVWMGRHPNDGNPDAVGEVGYFDITSDIDLDNAAGRKMARFLRADVGGGAQWSFDLLFSGPSPGAVPFLGYFNEASGSVNPDGSGNDEYTMSFDPEDFYNQVVTITYYMKAASSNSSFDGKLYFWWNGSLKLQRDDVPMGAMAFHRFQAPMIIRSPETDMTEYWWDVVAWEPGF